MESVQTPERQVRIHAENVGGIDETEVEFRPGVNVLTGRNASNRTSLLQAIMAALGSDRASLKADADRGLVELELDGETYSRTIERRDGDVAFGGEPYAEDPELSDLFAFLLESNDARRAVALGEDLREIIMRPVDTEAVQAEIAELEERKRDVESRLQERGRLVEEVASLEEEREELEARIEEKRDTLATKREEIEAADAELEETRERKDVLESRLEELRDRRSTLEDVRFRLETERETVEGLGEELDDVEAELDEYPETPSADVDELEERIESLRRRKRALDSQVNQLQTLVQFNEEMLEGDGVDDLGAAAGSAGDVTDRLLEGEESFVCWTCGDVAAREDIEETIEDLRERRKALVGERGEVTSELDEAKERKTGFVERERRRSDLERRRERVEEERREAAEAIESLEARRDELVEEVAGIEEDVESLREEEFDDLVELHKEANALELEVEQIESELERTEASLASARERAGEMESLEEEQSEIQADLEGARTRIERLEDEAVDAFNDHMATVLDVLDYGNLARIWIERTEGQVREGRRTTSRGFFDLHVVRNTESGTVYEDTVDHLSESEREVTGLVFALAGYLAHDVHETMPFMLLDSIEAIDSDRIATLVEYLGDYAEYLVVALLPEDAEPVDDRHRKITDI